MTSYDAPVTRCTKYLVSWYSLIFIIYFEVYFEVRQPKTVTIRGKQVRTGTTVYPVPGIPTSILVCVLCTEQET